MYETPLAQASILSLLQIYLGRPWQNGTPAIQAAPLHPLGQTLFSHFYPVSPRSF